MLKTFLQDIAVVLWKKLLKKQLIFEKLDHFESWQKLPPSKMPLQNGHFGSKIKNAKKHSKNASTRHCSCSMQKTAPKNS